MTVDLFDNIPTLCSFLSIRDFLYWLHPLAGEIDGYHFTGDWEPCHFLKDVSIFTTRIIINKCIKVTALFWFKKKKESPTRCTSCGRTGGLREVSTDRYNIDVTSLARRWRSSTFLSLFNSFSRLIPPLYFRAVDFTFCFFHHLLILVGGTGSVPMC